MHHGKEVEVLVLVRLDLGIKIEPLLLYSPPPAPDPPPAAAPAAPPFC